MPSFVMPIILTSIDRYGSVMVAEYTPTPGKKDHWDCAMLAERMKSARGEVARVIFDAKGERRILH
jgi:hypothetical protein